MQGTSANTPDPNRVITLRINMGFMSSLINQQGFAPISLQGGVCHGCPTRCRTLSERAFISMVHSVRTVGSKK